MVGIALAIFKAFQLENQKEDKILTMFIIFLGVISVITSALFHIHLKSTRSLPSE